jgi:hypothetical protein
MLPSVELAKFHPRSRRAYLHQNTAGQLILKVKFLGLVAYVNDLVLWSGSYILTQGI